MEKNRLIDLQVHTTASDGRSTLDTVLNEALDKRISVLAITDHDTIEGVSSENLQAVLQRLVDGVSSETLQKVYKRLGRDSICRERRGTVRTDRFFVDNMVVIQGEEVSCKYRGHGMHILAYFLDEKVVEGSDLGKHNRRMAYATPERAKSMVEKLQQAGYVINFEEISQYAESPHAFNREFIARYLMGNNGERLRREIDEIRTKLTVEPGKKPPSDLKIVRDIILGPDSPFYEDVSAYYKLPVDQFEKFETEPAKFPTMEDAVRMILECGGVPVLSHPGRYEDFIDQREERRPVRYASRAFNRADATRKPKILYRPEDVIRDLKAASKGLAGIEVFNPRHHTQHHVQLWGRLAQEYNLFSTAGTDFHGGKDMLGVPVSDNITMNLYNVHDRVQSSRNKKI